MRLVITVDVDVEESGLDPKVVKEAIEAFAEDLIITGAENLEIGLTLQKVECEGVTWTRQ